MNAKLLQEQMMKLETNYGREKFVITKDIFELWKEMFADCDIDIFKLAIDKCIKENEYAPNIATIYKYYNHISEKENELEKVVKAQYKLLRSTWEEDVDLKTFEALKGLVLHFPEINRKGILLDFSERAMSYRNGLRGEGRTDIPTLFEYIQGKR